MKTVWTVADSIISPLGFTTSENYEKIRNGVSGIEVVQETSLSKDAIYAAKISACFAYSSFATRFESLCIKAISTALTGIDIPLKKTLFILSTTKGNIELLNLSSNFPKERLHLYSTAKFIAEKFGFENHYVVSNACISGVLSLIVAKRLMQAGRYDHAVVLGADVLSSFVINGFQSLQALSPSPCKPFDANRTGINLGEAGAVIVLSTLPNELGLKPTYRLLGEGLSNDANHISGPSRTGSELAQAMNSALKNSSKQANDIDCISAHGTATVYNDEMEAKALALAKMEAVPIHSLKGYYGHTLGAAGILETIITMQAANNDQVVGTKGYQSLGVSKHICVSNTFENRKVKTILKTASGFGGCNAALVLEKVNNN